MKTVINGEWDVQVNIAMIFIELLTTIILREQF